MVEKERAKERERKRGREREGEKERGGACRGSLVRLSFTSASDGGPGGAYAVALARGEAPRRVEVRAPLIPTRSRDLNLVLGL